MLLFVLLALFSGHAVSYRFFHKSFTGSFSQQACKDGTLLAEVRLKKDLPPLVGVVLCLFCLFVRLFCFVLFCFVLFSFVFFFLIFF